MVDRAGRRGSRQLQRPEPVETPPPDPTIRPGFGETGVLGPDPRLGYPVTQAPPAEAARVVAAPRRISKLQGPLVSDKYLNASPLRQEMAAFHVVWQELTYGFSSTAIAKAFAYTNEDEFAANAELRELFNRDGLVGMIAWEQGKTKAGQSPFGIDPNGVIRKYLEMGEEQIHEIRVATRNEEIVLNRAEGQRIFNESVYGPLWQGDVTMADYIGLEEGGASTRVESVSLEELGLGEFSDDPIVQMEHLGVTISNRARFKLDERGVIHVAGGFLDAANGRPFTFFTTLELRLIGQIETETKGQKMFWTYDIQLDEGTVIDSPGDALTAITHAIWGSAHTLLRADDAPGLQTPFGKFIEFVGNSSDVVARTWDNFNQPWNMALGGDWIKSKEIYAAEIQARRDGLVYQFSEDDVITAGISSMMGDDGSLPFDRVGQVLDYWDEKPEEEKEVVRREMFQVGSMAHEEALANITDERSTLERGIDTAIQKVMTSFDWWERLTQTTSIAVVDFFGDLGEGILEATGLMEADARSQAEGGLLFFNAFDLNAAGAWHGETTAADYVGLEEDSPWRGTVNIAASILGDPFTWIGASGVVRSMRMTRLLGTEAGIEQFLKLPHVKNDWIRQIVKYSRGENDLALSVLMIDDGIRPEALKLLMGGTNLSDDLIVDVLRQELTDGFLAPTLGGGLRHRDAAMWVARMAKYGGDRFGGFLRRSIGTFSSTTSLNLSPGGFLPSAFKLGLARSTVGEWSRNPRLFREFMDELLDLATDMRQASREQAYIAANANRAAIRELGSESRELGHARFLREEAPQVIKAEGRMEELLAEKAGLVNRTVSADDLDSALSRAEEAFLREGTTESRRVFDDALAARNGFDDSVSRIAEIDTIVDDIQRGDELIGEAAHAARGGDEAAVGELAEVQARVQRNGPILPRGLTTKSPDYQKAKDFADDWSGRMAAAKTERRKLEALKVRLQMPSDRTPLIEFIAKFYDDWGREAGLADADGVLDWSRAGAVKGTGNANDLALSIALEGGAEGAEAKMMADLIRTSGVLSVAGSTTLPVAPMQMVAFHSRSSEGWWNKFFLDPARRNSTHFIRRNLAKTSDLMRTTFSANVLFNPFTIWRSNIDEVIRDIIERGYLGRPSEAVPGTRVTGPLIAGLQRQVESLGGQRLNARFAKPLDDIALSQRRRIARPFTDEPGETTMFVRRSSSSKSPKEGDSTVSRVEFDEASSQMMNGVLPSQPTIRAWAQSVYFEDKSIIADWWNGDGGRLISGQVVDTSTGRMTDMTMKQVIDASEAVLDFFMLQVAEGSRDRIKAAVIKAWATGENLDRSILRQFDFMPAVSSRSTGYINGAFEMFFGGPATRHGRMVYRDFYDQTYGILKTRHQDRMLTPERLVETASEELTLTEARIAIERMSPLADRAVREGGFVTERMLHVNADRIAQTHAEHMAYQMGATSLGGQRLAQAFPFLRAQLDFIGWYTKSLTNGAVLGLNPALKPLFRKGAAKLGRNVDELIDIPHLPINLRLAGRVGDIGGGLSTVKPDSDDYFANFVDDYTFFPSSADDIYLQLAPGLAPIPAWMLHALPIEGEGYIPEKLASLRVAAEAFLPGFGFFEGQTRIFRPWEIGQFMLGDGPRTVRRVLGRIGSASFNTAIDILPQMGFMSSAQIDAVNSFLGMPPGFYTDFRVNSAMDLAENPFQVIGDTDFDRLSEEILESSYKRTSYSALMETVIKWGDLTQLAGGFLLDADQGEWLPLYEGFVDSELVNLWQTGKIGDQQFETITELWAKIIPQELTFEDAVVLSDNLSAVLFGMTDIELARTILKHPELVGNMVSMDECDGAPPGKCDGTRLKALPTEAGRALRKRGKAQGWLVRRDPADQRADMFRRWAAAYRAVRNDVWFRGTGLQSWSRPGPGELDPKLANEALLTSGQDSRDALALWLDMPAIAEATTRQQLNDALYEPSRLLTANVYESQSRITDPKRSVATENTVRYHQDRMDDRGIEANDVRSWEEASRAAVRDAYALDINSGLLTLDEYNAELGRSYGEIRLVEESQLSRGETRFGEATISVVRGWRPPQPPALNTVPIGSTEETYRLPVPKAFIRVIDGDTIELSFPAPAELAAFADRTPSGLVAPGRAEDTTRVRLIGVNAAEINTNPTYAEQMRALSEDPNWIPPAEVQKQALGQAIDAATEIDLVVFNPTEFATLQTVDTGKIRWLMVLYLDGVAQWDEAVFTSVNPTGASIGGTGIPSG
jgi:hypothetical protein